MTTFCWLPPESDAAGAVGPPPRTSNSASSRRRRGHHAPGEEPAVREAGGLSESWSAMFSARVNSMTSPRRWRSLGMWPHAGLEHVVRARAGDVPARRRTIVPDVGLRRPAIASISSAWPLPSTPGDPTISPARTSRDKPRTTSRPRSSWTTRSATWSSGSPGLAGRLVDRQDDLAADHELGELASVAPARGLGADRLAAAQHRDPVGDVEHLVELVGDEDDRRALRGEAAQDRRRARWPPGASAPRSARPGSGCRRRGRAPSGSRRAAACRP